MSPSVANELPRFGLKGRAAADWLAGQGVALPQQPNTWLALADQGRVLRLGRGEFLLEGDAAERLESAWQDGRRDLYRVPRYDAAFVLTGAKATVLLQEICMLDTRPQAMAGQVLMTLAAGISVTLVCETDAAVPVYRLWCDATYGDYMKNTLQEILD
jgi:sarcosine oxidase, subunit gamma